MNKRFTNWLDKTLDTCYCRLLDDGLSVEDAEVLMPEIRQAILNRKGIASDTTAEKITDRTKRDIGRGVKGLENRLGWLEEELKIRTDGTTPIRLNRLEQQLERSKEETEILAKTLIHLNL